MTDFNDVDPKDLKIEFAPGCFDNFDGTQEELDELINELRRLVKTGEILEKGRAIDLDDLSEEDQEIIDQMSINSNTVRTLQ